jgi:hypothetical protein
VTKINDNGKAADIFYLDFAKAFAKVPRERLLVKMQAKGITGKILSWVRNWLENRTQRVVVGDEISEETSVDRASPRARCWDHPYF